MQWSDICNSSIHWHQRWFDFLFFNNLFLVWRVLKKHIVRLIKRRESNKTEPLLFLRWKWRIVWDVQEFLDRVAIRFLLQYPTNTKLNLFIHQHTMEEQDLYLLLSLIDHKSRHFQVLPRHQSNVCTYSPSQILLEWIAEVWQSLRFSPWQYLTI